MSTTEYRGGYGSQLSSGTEVKWTTRGPTGTPGLVLGQSKKSARSREDQSRFSFVVQVSKSINTLWYIYDPYKFGPRCRHLFVRGGETSKVSSPWDPYSPGFDKSDSSLDR